MAGSVMDAAFQDRVLACMQRVPEFLSVVSEHTMPEYFDGVPRQNICKMIRDFWTQYNTFVTDPAFTHILGNLVRDGKIKEIELRPHMAQWKALKSQPVTDWKFTLDEMVKFVKHQRIKALINNSVSKLLPKGDYAAIEKEMAKIAGITVGRRVKAYDYFSKEAIAERQKTREEELKSGKISISTGIKPLDDKLHAGGFYQGELYVFMAPPKRGKCVTRDTMLLTEDGLVEIGDYIPESMPVGSYSSKKLSLLGMDGIEQTSHIYNSGLTPTIKVAVENGMTIEGTPHHPMLVMRDGHHEWVELQDLKCGDWLVSKCGQMIFGSHDNLDYAVEAGKKRIEASKRQDAMAKVCFPKTMTEGLAEWLGMLVAEGYCSKRGDMHFTQKDESTLQRYCELSAGLFGKTPGVVRQEGKTACAQMTSRPLQAYLEALGVEWGVSKHKQVPKAVRMAGEGVQRAFLRTLLSLEGAVIKSNKSTVHYELTMASEKLMRQVQIMLLNFGIKSRLCRKDGMATNGTRQVRPYWRAKVSGGRNIAELKGAIGLFDGRKHSALPDTFKPATAREWIPDSRRLVQGVIEEIKAARKTIRSLFSKSEHWSLKRFASGVTGEVRELTVAFAEKIVDRLNSVGVRGECSDQLRYILDGGFCYTAVDSIVVGEAVTVDFTVPGTHSFFANGLISHNTMSLLWFSNQAALQGYNVAHFSCEVSKEICAKRLDAMNTKTLIREVDRFNRDVATRLVTKIPRGKLMLYGYPTKSLTPAMVETEIDRLLNEEGIRVDMVVADYLDIMRLPNPDKSSSWADQGPLAEELRRIAGEYSVPVITATQINRAGAGKAVTSGKDVSGNYEKIMIADEIFSLSATDEELKEGKLRIHNSESRNSESGTILISTAFAYGQFFSDFIGEEV